MQIQTTTNRRPEVVARHIAARKFKPSEIVLIPKVIRIEREEKKDDDQKV